MLPWPFSARKHAHNGGVFWHRSIGSNHGSLPVGAAVWVTCQPCFMISYDTLFDTAGPQTATALLSACVGQGLCVARVCLLQARSHPPIPWSHVTGDTSFVITTDKEGRAGLRRMPETPCWSWVASLLTSYRLRASMDVARGTHPCFRSGWTEGTGWPWGGGTLTGYPNEDRGGRDGLTQHEPPPPSGPCVWV